MFSLYPLWQELFFLSWMNVEFYQMLFLHLLRWSCGYCHFFMYHIDLSQHIYSVCLHSIPALQIDSSVIFFYIIYICVCVNMWYLFFSFWLTLFCVTGSVFIHLSLELTQTCSFLLIVPLLPSHCGFFAFGHGVSFFGSFQNPPVDGCSTAMILVFSQQMGARLSTLPSWTGSPPFPILNQSVVPCPVLTVASWPAYRFLG